MSDLLFELGTEDLPAGFLISALDDMERIFKERCSALSIQHGTIRRFATPRRLAILVSNLAETTEDVTKQVLGPLVRAAFDSNGAPKVAAIKFAQSMKVPLEMLERVQMPRGEYLAVLVHESGRRVVDQIPEVLNACIRNINFPKSMRWGDVEASFGRPLHWIVALFGQEIVPIAFADVQSGRFSRGHRFLAPEKIMIDAPQTYESQLEKAHVIPDIEKRKKMLLDGVNVLAQREGIRPLLEEAFVDQVVNLVELPSPVIGMFDSRHLDLPPEVLVQEMKVHQRYFPLIDEQGGLVPKFIAVSNTPVKNEGLSIKGYERVLRARLTDGRFFFDEDRRIPLSEWLSRLQRRTWVATLGSMAEKTDRIRKLSQWLSITTNNSVLVGTVERAAALCKADLETAMVGEFPELQGVMGREYAKHSGETPEVALAIFEHYLPRGAFDRLPSGDTGALIGLADRLDSLSGLFSIGKKPTGAKDDFALRRAAITFIRIVLGRSYRFSLTRAIEESLQLLQPKLANAKKAQSLPDVKLQLLEFFRGRLEVLWREDHRPDIVDAVLSVGFDDLVASQKRLEALSTQVSRPDFVALVGTFKRVANIVTKQAADITQAPVDISRFSDESEKVLHEQFVLVRDSIRAALNTDDFTQAISNAALLKRPVDAFFDKVMVLSDDRQLRENRVRMLIEISAAFGAIADFSKVQIHT